MKEENISAIFEEATKWIDEALKVLNEFQGEPINVCFVSEQWNSVGELFRWLE